MRMAHAALLTILVVVMTPQLYTSSADECNSKNQHKFPAILVFGDSTVDSGNNNYLLTTFRGDHRPYGSDFPGQVPTGRLSNGKLVPDLMASILGIKETVPPFLDPTLSDQDILTGVTFASAGSGFDDLTTVVSGVIPVSRQPDHFKNYIRRLEGVVGEEEAAARLSKSLVIISAGTNDHVLNYYDIPTRRFQFNIHQYQDFLQTKLQILVKKVYDLGCRKFVVSGIPPIGCLPIQMTAKLRILRRCVDEENEDARSYNDKLEKLLPQMEAELPGSRILFADIFNPLIDMIKNPLKYEFVETRRGCCGSGLLEAGPLCTQFAAVCSNHSNYLFWDSIHPTESTYKILANTFHSLIPKMLLHHNMP